MPSFPARSLDRRWMFFGLAALSLLMSSIDGTIVAVALPTLIEDLHASLVLAGWTLTSYALTQTVMLPIAGKLAEQFGQMRVFLICVFLFTLGSLLCGLAPTIYVLILCRVLQALGGGGFMPSATGMVATAFPESRGRMIGLFASIFPIGAILGPNLGGFIIQNFGWRQIFLINVPIGILVVALLARQARQIQPAESARPARPGGRRRIDLVGTILFTGTVVSFMLALTFLGETPALIYSPLFWLLIGLSGLLLAGFIWQERRAPDPMLDLSLVGRQPFLVVNLYSILTGACFMGFFSFIPYYATIQYAMGPQESGAILTPRSLVMIAVSTSTSFLLHRLGYRRPMLIGTACIVGVLFLLGHGLSGISIGPIQTGPLVPLLLVMSLSGLGMGMLIPASNNAGLDLLPRRAAVISGIRGLFSSTGGVIGTAIIVLWLELSPDKAEGLRTVFTSLGVVILVTLPLVFLIPDAVTDRRKAGKRAESARPEISPMHPIPDTTPEVSPGEPTPGESIVREPLAATPSGRPER